MQTTLTKLQLPGPRLLPIIGSAWTLWPVIGPDKVTRMHEGYLKKYKKYGSIVRENFYGKNVVSIFDPRYIAAVFHSENNLNPQRVSLNILLEIRKERRDLFNTVGMVPANGMEWKNLRNSYQTEMITISLIEQYILDLGKVANEFVEYVKFPRAGVPDLQYRLQEWALESVCVVTLDHRVDTLRIGRNSFSRQLIDGANASLHALAHAEYSPFWRFLPSSKWKTVSEVDVLFYEFVREQLKLQVGAPWPTNKPPCVLKKYLANPANDFKDIITITSDLLFTGLLTTAMAMGFFLYNLAINPVKQELLYQNVNKFYPNKNIPVTAKQIAQMRYLKGCIMENFRMSAITLGTSRILRSPVTLAGHTIPPGTYVLTQNQVAGMLPEFIHQPEDFIPERWFRDNERIPGYEKFEKPHPFLVVPFGSGPRSCLGRRLAELEISVLAVMMVKNYKLEYAGKKPLKIITKMISIPDGPLDIKFIRREDN